MEFGLRLYQENISWSTTPIGIVSKAQTRMLFRKKLYEENRLVDKRYMEGNSTEITTDQGIVTL
jgi:hypothetical protein